MAVSLSKNEKAKQALQYKQMVLTRAESQREGGKKVKANKAAREEAKEEDFQPDEDAEWEATGEGDGEEETQEEHDDNNQNDRDEDASNEDDANDEEIWQRPLVEGMDDAHHLHWQVAAMNKHGRTPRAHCFLCRVINPKMNRPIGQACEHCGMCFHKQCHNYFHHRNHVRMGEDLRSHIVAALRLYHKEKKEREEEEKNDDDDEQQPKQKKQRVYRKERDYDKVPPAMQIEVREDQDDEDDDSN